jgi:hypothetical protein
MSLKDLFATAENNKNPIISLVHQMGNELCGDPVELIQGIMCMWYQSTSPFIARDPQQGRPTAENNTTAPGHHVQRWNRHFSGLKHILGNLGLMAMLLTAENWRDPGDDELHCAALVANTATTMIYAAYTIFFRMNILSWKYALKSTSVSLAMKSFLKCAWQVARVRYGGSEACYPGQEFGANPQEVKISWQGKRLSTNIGRRRRGWHEPPFWHPLRVVPGSCWNKFLKNTARPYFPTDDSPCVNIVYRFPSTAVKLCIPFESYYAQLRGRMDLVRFSSLLLNTQ